MNSLDRVWCTCFNCYKHFTEHRVHYQEANHSSAKRTCYVHAKTYQSIVAGLTFVPFKQGQPIPRPRGEVGYGTLISLSLLLGMAHPEIHIIT